VYVRKKPQKPQRNHKHSLLEVDVQGMSVILEGGTSFSGSYACMYPRRKDEYENGHSKKVENICIGTSSSN
jgi:hypothetical protein